MNRIITYSLLAHIHNTGTLVGGLIDIFIPLVKRSISLMNRDGIHQDKSIITIKDYTDRLYGLDIPLPVLKNVLSKVASQINSKDKVKFQLFHDNSFSIKDYLFEEFEETIDEQKKNIEKVEHTFEEFCKINSVPKSNYKSIFEFIEKNKRSLSRYLTKKENSPQQDFSIEAQFVEYFRPIPNIYDFIRRVYLGSILSSYLEYKTENLKTEVELLFDTNFIISLIDLNTPESTHTCKKLLEITKSQGFKLSVLKDTIEESQRLLHKKAEYYEAAFLQRKVNPEDIYNACERRKLTRTDIERISDNLESTLQSEGINVLSDTTKFQNLAKFSKEYEDLKNIRNNNVAALHDATAIYYVRDKRKKRIVEFENVNCWFVNNTISYSQYGPSQEERRDYQPEAIRVDDLLNILWLSNPNINVGVSDNDLADIGITALISVTLSETLPKASIIRELDDNIRKYGDERLTDKDVIRVATRITKRQLRDIEGLNELAKNNSKEFTSKLLKESETQKTLDEERFKRLEELFKKLEDQSKKLEATKDSYNESKKRADEKASGFDEEVKSRESKIKELNNEVERQKKARLTAENKRRENERKRFIEKAISTWRNKSWREFWVCIVIFAGLTTWTLYSSNWSINIMLIDVKDIKTPIILLIIGTIINTIFFGIVVKTLVDKYRNHSNIKAFRESIEISKELVELKGLE